MIKIEYGDEKQLTDEYIKLFPDLYEDNDNILHHFRYSFKEIITANFRRLLEICQEYKRNEYSLLGIYKQEAQKYSDDISFRNDIVKADSFTDVDKIIKNKCKSELGGNTINQTVISKIKKYLRYSITYIFDYDRNDSKIAKFIISKINIRTCFYCNISYISVLPIKNKNKSYKHEFELDHFLPKSKVPIIALSLFNFVPSCKICNQTIKHDNELLSFDGTSIKDYWGKTISIDDADKLSPTSTNYKFDTSIKFKTIWKKGTPVLSPMIINKNSFEFDFDINDNVYKKELLFFATKERYDNHIVEAMRLHELQMKYPQSHLEELAKTIYSDPLKADWVREDIFGEGFMQNENRAFAKMHKDIMSEYDKSK